MLPFRLPIADWIEVLVDVLLDNFQPVFRLGSDAVFLVVDGIRGSLMAVPPVILVVLAALVAWRLGGRGVALFTLIGLLIADNIGLWRPLIATFSLVLCAEI